jgi:hypothetical protein
LSISVAQRVPDQKVTDTVGKRESSIDEVRWIFNISASYARWLSFREAIPPPAEERLNSVIVPLDTLRDKTVGLSGSFLNGVKS